MNTVEFTPVADTSILRDLLDRVPQNRRYSITTVKTAVPFDINGVAFRLKVSQTGIPITITTERPAGDNSLLDQNAPNIFRILPKDEVTEVRLPLPPGISNIQLESDLGNLDLRIAVEDYVTWIASFGQLLDDGTLSRLRDREDSILSPTGSVLTERWFPEADLLPRNNGLHRLAMRMINDGYKNSGTQRAVERAAAAICGNNPVLYRIHSEDILDYVEHTYTTEEEFSGAEFHIWVYDTCLTSFLTAGRYVQNFPQHWTANQYGEGSISYTEVESDTTHTLVNTAGDKGCSIEDILLQQGCFDRFRPWVRMTRRKSFVMCMAGYTFNTQVEVCKALGAVYLDCENLTLEGVITDPDMVDVEDPTGDGWVGQALDGRFDYPYGGGFDTWGVVEEFLADQCPYQRGPVATPLFTVRADVEIEHPIEAFGTLAISGITALPGRGGILTPV